MSLHPLSNEIVIHVAGQFDIRLKSERRKAIMDVLKIFYVSITKNNLPIYGVVTKLIFKDFRGKRVWEFTLHCKKMLQKE